MLFWLKKALTLPFLPLYFALFTALAGNVLLCSKRRRLGRALVAASLLALAVFSNKGVAARLVEPLEARYVPMPEARVAGELPLAAVSCRAIVVLGGGHGDSAGFSRVNQLSSSALGRLAEAVRLARLLPEAKVMVSGDNGAQRLSHAQILAEAAGSLGITPDRIVRLDSPRDTDDEAQELARRLGREPFLLVTSAWHMPRAMALCEKAGLRPVAAPADFLLRPGVDTDWEWVSWDLGALERSTKAIHERLGLLWLQLRGRV